MNEARLKIVNSEGQLQRELTLALPSSLYEVPLNRYIDFIVAVRGIDTVQESEQLVKMVEALAAFFDAPLSDFFESSLNEPNGPGDIIQGVNQLFAYIANISGPALNELKMDGVCTFEYGGEQWVIPTLTQQALSGVILPHVSVAQAVEALEISRLGKTLYDNADTGDLRHRVFDVARSATTPEMRQALEDAANAVWEVEREAAADPQGSQMYTRYIKMLALFARRLGGTDEMPLSDNQRAVWLADRMRHFAGSADREPISAAAALKVDFFLNSILLLSKKSLPPVGFLSVSIFGLQGAVRIRFGQKQKRGKKQLRKQKKRLRG